MLELPVLNGQPGRACPKGPTRLDVKVAKVKAADSNWETCKRTVDVRDGMKCRVCKHKVIKTIELDPKRAEHHHLCHRRKEKALLTDPRNILLCCLRCHQKLGARMFHPVQKAALQFELNGSKFVNADHPMTFVPWKGKA